MLGETFRDERVRVHRTPGELFRDGLVSAYGTGELFRDAPDVVVSVNRPANTVHTGEGE